MVWESNRSGDWRLWIRDLDGSQPRQLTRGESASGDSGRQHCCPHVAPDGSGVVYLSLPKGQELYPESGAAGPMHLIRPDGTGDRALVDVARTYYEHRAAVWKTRDELIFIDSGGRTGLLSLTDGSTRALTEDGEESHGWLVDSTLTWATRGLPVFSRYDAEARRIRRGRDLGGCQPYFSHDGRWGYWIAGAGGPIRRVDLATSQVGTILGKGDPRLPAERNYVYFPMTSADGRLLAFAASDGDHSHHTADYDVFVAETDPRTLDVVGPVRRVTSDPATDRFPDVYSAPLALGRHFGEAPFTVELAPAEAGEWTFTANGAEIGRGRRVRATFDRPGTYDILAGDHRGRVTVSPARPPEVVRVEVRRGRDVVVSFDEEVDVGQARVAFASGRKIAGQRLDGGGRALVVELAADVRQADVLILTGLTDRAQVPQLLPETRLEIEPPRWPYDRRGLVFLWETGDAANQVEDPETGATRTCTVESRGRCFLDRDFALVLAGGDFAVDGESVAAVFEGCRETSELTVEATVTPARPVRGPGRILTFSGGDKERNFTLGQEDDRLIFRLRTRTTGRNADRPQLDLGAVPMGRPSHVVVTYTPGKLLAFVDGERVLESEEIQSGFHHWKPRVMLFGNESRGVDRPWYGTVEGVAIYNRVMGAEEASENHRRYADKIASRRRVETLRLRAELVRRPAIPTLREISPYREALAVFEYRVAAVLAGAYSEPRVRVASWVLLDEERTPRVDREAGEVYEIEISRFSDNRQLESVFLPEAELGKGPLYFEGGVE